MTPTVPRLQESDSVIVGTFVSTFLTMTNVDVVGFDGNNQMYSSPEIAALSEIIIYIYYCCRSNDNEIIYYR